MQVKDKISKAKRLLLINNRQPFFAQVVLPVPWEVDNTIETASTNGKRVRYNEEFINTLDLDMTIGLIAHQSLHTAFGHSERMSSRDPELWNKACDLAINPLILHAGLKLPPGVLLEDRFLKWAVEDIYNVLYLEQQPPEEPEPEPQQQQQPGAGKGEGAEDQDSPGNDTGENSDPGNSGNEGNQPENGEKPQSGEEQGGNNPAGATGEPQGEGTPEKGTDPHKTEKEAKNSLKTPQSWGWVEPAQVESPEERATMEREHKQTISEALRITAEMGNATGLLKQMIDQFLKPRVNWREVLNHWLTEKVKTDYNWRTPNRRYMTQNIYLPALETDEIGQIALILDTSGSVYSNIDVIRSFVTELQEVTKLLTMSGILIHADTKVQHTEEIEELTKIKPVGGGGTDFAPAFKWIEENTPEIKGAIYLTDGYCWRFPEEPAFPVIWAIYNNPDFNPPFGEVVQVYSDDDNF